MSAPRMMKLGLNIVANGAHAAGWRMPEAQLDFFDAAHLNPNVPLVTGSVCGVRVENVEDPLMQNIRRLDKLIDELAKGRPMEKILRS